MSNKTLEDRIARLEALMDQVVSSPRVRPYVLGQVEQRLAPAEFVTPTSDIKEKFPPSKDELVAAADVERCQAEIDRIRMTQIEAQTVQPGKYLTDYGAGQQQVVVEVSPGDVNGAFAIELTPELREAEARLVKAKLRLFKIQGERDRKAREWTWAQSGIKPAPAEKQMTRRYLGR